VFDYQRIRDQVAVIIGKYGAPMVLRVPAPGAYDPATGGRATDSPYVDYSCFGTVDEYDIRDIDGTLIKEGDKRVTLSASSAMPDPVKGNILIMAGVEWSVERCKPTAPAGISVVYEVQVRL
jgi:hypothetical protein